MRGLPQQTQNCDSPEDCNNVVVCEDGDDDCPAELCGNGTLDGDETCDGDCPTCDDGDDCTEDVMTGTPETCDVVCTNTAIEPCAALCGNGTLDPGETCDGDCPTCDDGEVCTTDGSTGSAETCDLVCTTRPTISCFAGDGCCPSNCVEANDADCACVPLTCEGEGQACGMLDDGCGQTLLCGPCGANQTCLDAVCQDSLGIGDSCPNLVGCALTGTCIGEASTGWPDGYCTQDCVAGGPPCPPGTHCGQQACLQTCTDDSECARSPEYQCFDRDEDGQTECAPVATGAGVVGSACTTFADCAGGQEGFCLRENVSTGDWNDGYCSEDCTADTDCPSGSHCVTNACLADCQQDSDCRGFGYGCGDFDGDSRLECVSQPVKVGDPCLVDTDCSGPDFGTWGVCRQPYVDGGGVTRVPDGYCTIQCGANQGTCPTGITCHDFAGNGAFLGCLLPCDSTGMCPLPGHQCLSTTSGQLCL